MTEYPEDCPHCGKILDGGDVYEKMFSLYRDPERALEEAEQFGWSKENPVRFSKIVGVYNIETDRTEYFICPNCKEVIDITKNPSSGYTRSGAMVIARKDENSPE